MNNSYIIGKNVYLRQPDLTDLDGNWYKWFSDQEVTKYLVDRYWPNDQLKQKEHFDSILNNKTQNNLVLSICTIKDDKHIGVCSLGSINWVHRYADISYIIGEKEYRNGVFAVEVSALLLEIAFKRLNLLNLRATHFSDHPLTPLMLKLFGFKKVGSFNQFLYSNNIYVDLIYWQLKREDWLKRNSK
jgi:RimJ/RimL family protein N-acetyltransferase